jgi:hypothetical protein
MRCNAERPRDELVVVAEHELLQDLELAGREQGCPERTRARLQFRDETVHERELDLLEAARVCAGTQMHQDGRRAASFFHKWAQDLAGLAQRDDLPHTRHRPIPPAAFEIRRREEQETRNPSAQAAARGAAAIELEHLGFYCLVFTVLQGEACIQEHASVGFVPRARVGRFAAVPACLDFLDRFRMELRELAGL